MVRIPVLGRLRSAEWPALIYGLVLVVFEIILHVVVAILPSPIISWFHDKSRSLFHIIVGRPSAPTAQKRMADRIRLAQDFEELCGLFGYTPEEHIVHTKDGYLLGIHRLPCRKGETKERPGTSTGKPVVYLHHGLLMNSEVWVCLTDEERALPFVLVEQGYDVWLGNNRGNKYSKKSIHYTPNQAKFWNYSLDDFAFHDIPDTIDYIIDTVNVKSLSYVGFSQGTAQAFAALSVNPKLNNKIDVFVALAPAMSPHGLSAPLVDGLMKASPKLVFLFFGRKQILASTAMWQSILYPPIFVKTIDASLSFLFDWRSTNISLPQKLASYAHLFSFASVKSVVHWFQIMRTGQFQMYDDDNTAVFHGGRNFYRPARFPTRNIVTPIVLLYGDRDSLVDIKLMLSELPSHTVAKGLRGYEHIDILWGKDVHRDVIPEVLEALKEHAPAPLEESKDHLQGTKRAVQLSDPADSSGHASEA